MNLLLKRKIDSYEDIEEEARKREEHYQIEIKELQTICEDLKNKNESLLSEINEKEKSLNELKQAYLEKSNQKESIENMYTTLRSQIHNNNNNNVSSRNGSGMIIPLRNNNHNIIMNRDNNRSYPKVIPTPSRTFDIDHNNNNGNSNSGGRKFLRVYIVILCFIIMFLSRIFQ